MSSFTSRPGSFLSGTADTGGKLLANHVAGEHHYKFSVLEIGSWSLGLSIIRGT